MRRDIHLPSFTLRRVRSLSSLDGQTPSASLVSEVETFAKESEQELIDCLLGHNERSTSRDTAERVLAQVNRGWIAVMPADLALGASRSGDEPASDEAPVSLVSLAKEEEPPPPVSFAPETPQHQAQAASLVSASNEGQPFCEVCEAAAKATETDDTHAVDLAQAATLERAAQSGAPFCEVCEAAAKTG